MKLIIDIDDNSYELINKTSITLDFDTVFHGKEKDKELTFAVFDLVKALKNGTHYEERPHENWIPVTYRPMTEEEEKEFCVKWGIKEGSLEDWEKRVFTCPLPEDGQEILISTRWGVSEDVCSWDDDSIGLEDRGDWDGVDAWMPKPEPYKKEGKENGKV